MSGIAAIYDASGAPVDREQLQGLLDAIAHRGSQGHVWLAPGIALGQRILPTTPEATREGLPTHVCGGRYQIALDGRLDNREDLAQGLGIYLFREAPTDADLIALAYERWQTACLDRIIGDFAFALWDSRSGSLFAARDQRGFRPLVYARVGQRLIVGSEPQQLFAHPDVPRTIDSLVLACHLTGAVPEPGATPYASVAEVPPAHYLLARGDEVLLQEYWRFGPRPTLRYKRREEYVEHFEEVFGQATAAAVRAPSAPAVLLSGGLDSSYVAARAREATPNLRAYNAYVKGSSGMDERHYARAVGHQLGISVQEIPVDDCWSLSSHYLPDSVFDQPNVPMQAPLMVRLAEAARDDGVCVLLDGIGGDECMSSSTEYIAELLIGGHWAHALRDASAWGRAYNRSTLSVLASAGLAPLTPNALRHRVRAWRGRPAPSPLPPWIDADAIAALGLDAALETPEVPTLWRKADDLELFWALHRREVLPVIGWRERQASLPAGVEARSPFWDLRVVELMLRFPSWVNVRPGRSKALLRDAMRPRLPEVVVERTDKGIFDELMNTGLLDRDRERVDAALLDGPLGRLFYVDGPTLATELETYRSRQHPWWHALWRAITAGLWLREQQGEEVSHGTQSRQLVDA
ncbi:MAG: asparagine synthase-related protein [Dehalococcoidia bacterium]